MRPTRKNVIFFLLIIALCVPIFALSAKTSGLDKNEETHLIFMREEEKLARDVYITLGKLYGENSDLALPFKKIIPSEQKHMDTMLDKLIQFKINDPNTDDTVGVFTGEDYGEYFTEKYDELVEEGSKIYLKALYVGALIEELDMHDISKCPAEIVKTCDWIGSEDQCGMDYTDERALIRSYGNLLEGSKNHFRAYVKIIEKSIGYGNYVAQYLSQEKVDEILGR